MGFQVNSESVSFMRNIIVKALTLSRIQPVSC